MGTEKGEVNRKSVMGSVIQAIGKVEFEDDSRTGVLLVPLW